METDKYIKFYKVEKEHWWFVARKNLIIHILNKCLPINSNSSLLDFGCGTGGNLDEFALRYNAFGADMSELAIEFCEKRKLKNLYKTQDILNLPEFKKKFDLITTLDVIEHIDDDLGILKNLKDLLKDDGHIFITVPAYMFLFGPHDVSSQHKRRYIKKQLRRVVEAAGFDIEKISYFNTFLSPLIIISRLISAKSGANKDDDIPAKIFNKLFRLIFEFEKYLLRYISFPFGISIMCIAKKK